MSDSHASAVHDEFSKVSYFETDGSIIASIGPMAVIAMFRIAGDGIDHLGPWEHLPHTSSTYEFFHQCIFRNHRAMAVPLERGQSFPPLPDRIPSRAEGLDTALSHPVIGQVASYPLVFAYLADQLGLQVPIFVVLREDLYESTFGDGCYRDLASMHLQSDSAAECVRQIDADSDYRGFVRQLSISLKGHAIVADDSDRQAFDTHRLEAVLSMLEIKIGQQDTCVSKINSAAGHSS